MPLWKAMLEISTVPSTEMVSTWLIGMRCLKSIKKEPLTFSCRHTRDFRCEETLSTPADRDTSQLPLGFKPTHLVGILGDGDEQSEGRAGRKGRAVVPLFLAPQAVLLGVEHHVKGPTVKPRVEMKSNVGVAPGATLEVHVESGDQWEL